MNKLIKNGNKYRDQILHLKQSIQLNQLVVEEKNNIGLLKIDWNIEKLLVRRKSNLFRVKLLLKNDFKIQRIYFIT